jgi:hypothetical protein
MGWLPGYLDCGDFTASKTDTTPEMEAKGGPPQPSVAVSSFRVLSAPAQPAFRT